MAVLSRVGRAFKLSTSNRSFRTLRGSGSTMASAEFSRKSQWPFVRETHTNMQAGNAVEKLTIPGSAPLSSRLRKSPYFERTLAAGVAEFTTYNRMLMPLGYEEGVATEYKALTENVAIWDVGAERQVELKGPEAAKLAQLLTCRDVSGLEVGKCVYAIMCDGDGLVINDPILLKLSENHYWFSIADSDVLLWAKAIAMTRNLDVKVTEPDVSPLAIQGPRAVDLLCDLYGEEIVSGLKHFGFVRGAETALPAAPNSGLPPIPTLLARSGWSPERGYEIYLEDGSRGSELWDMVWEAGKKYDIKPGAPNQQRRVEAGMLSFGADTLADTNALELGLPKRFVDPFGDHDFIGKDALQKLSKAEGQRKFVGINFMDEVLESQPYWQGQHLPIYESPSVAKANGPQLGVITSFSYSPRFERNLGLGYAESSKAVAGSHVCVKTSSGKIVEGCISKLPFTCLSGGAKVGGRTGLRD